MLLMPPLPRLVIDRLFHLHCGVIVAVVLGHLLSRLIPLAAGQETNLRRLLSLLEETAVPTVVATGGLLATAAAAALVALAARGNGERLARSWWFVAGCLAFMALDEGAALHTRLTLPVLRRLGLEAVPLGWALPYLLVTIAGAALCLPIAARLPRRSLWRILLAGGVYVGAALGLDMVGSLVMRAAAEGGLSGRELWEVSRQPLMTTLAALEESGELVGMALLLRALLLHLVEDRGIRAIRLERRDSFDDPG